MSTQQVTVSQGQWVAVNSVSTQGVMRLRKGSVIFTEQATLPTDAPANTPWSEVMSSVGRAATYSTNSGELLYAYGVSDSLIDVSPVGGSL